MSTQHLLTCKGGPLNNCTILCTVKRGVFKVDANDEDKRVHLYAMTREGEAKYVRTDKP